MGVAALRADVGHHFVILVGNGVVRGETGDAVDMMIDPFAQRRVLCRVILLIERVYLVEIRLFLCPVERSVLIGAFKKQVFEVVSEAGMVAWIRIAPCPYRDANRNP